MGDCSNGQSSGESCSSDCTNKLPPGILLEYDLNQDTSSGILVWAETSVHDGKTVIEKSVPGIIGKARRLSDDRVFAIVFGGNTDIKPLYGELFSYGVDTLYHIRNTDLDTYHPEAYAEAVSDLTGRIRPATILMSGTSRGREVAPIVAAMLQTGLVADCIDIESTDRMMTMTTHPLGSNILVSAVCNKFPQMATIRPGTFKIPEPDTDRRGTAINRPFIPSKLKTILDVKNTADDGFADIADYDILISLGGGIEDAETVRIAEEIAEKMGAGVSCSRRLAEKGLLPRQRQVGLSGKNVFPKLYLAFGISGSVEHMSGVHSAKIIAINSDPDAPIHKIADESIIGDATEILRRMNSIS